MKRPSLPFLFLVVSLSYFIVGVYLLWVRTNPQRLSFSVFQKSHMRLMNPGEPTHIRIPSIHVSLPIFPAAIRNNVWETTTQGVSYLTSSPKPGTKGNSILYGHDWQNLLGSLNNVRPGDTIVIGYQNEDEKIFTVSYVQKVPRNDMEVVKQTDDNRLTLFTCDGLFDENRIVVVALLGTPLSQRTP